VYSERGVPLPVLTSGGEWVGVRARKNATRVPPSLCDITQTSDRQKGLDTLPQDTFAISPRPLRPRTWPRLFGVKGTCTPRARPSCGLPPWSLSFC